MTASLRADSSGSGGSLPTPKFGYKAGAEQFNPRDLLEFGLLAEALGFDWVAVSDHFQPWRHTTGHSPSAIPWLAALGQATDRVMLGTSVLAPTLRYHPSIVAQAFATLACLFPGRVFLGVGTGEAMNERPATGMAWPPIKERRLRLAEAIKLMRQLWSHERVDFAGDYYRTERVTIYDRPEEPVPIYVAAAGPLAAKLAGRVGDGFITTSGKGTDRCRELLGKVDEGARGAGRDPGVVDRMIEIKISYDEDLAAARKGCNWWGALALSQEEKSGVEDPMELERLADASPASAETRFICTNDPDEAAARVQDYVDLGFTHLVFHSPGADQKRALELLARDVLPRLRAHAQAIHAAGQPISTMSSSQPA